MLLHLRPLIFIVYFRYITLVCSPQLFLLPEMVSYETKAQWPPYNSPYKEIVESSTLLWNNHGKITKEQAIRTLPYYAFSKVYNILFFSLVKLRFTPRLMVHGGDQPPLWRQNSVRSNFFCELFISNKKNLF
jgi:hypothetical protein